MSISVQELERKVLESIKRIEEELGVAEMIVLVDGSASCNQCIRIEVNDIDSFIKALSALARQGIATGAIPIIVVRRRTTTTITFQAVDITNQCLVTLELEIKY